MYSKFEGKNFTQFWGKNQHEFDKKLAKNASFASIKKNSQEDLTPPPSPYCERIKKLHSWTLIDFLQQRWKFSCITYIGTLRQKLLTILGQTSTLNRQKMNSECTICIHFHKNFPGEAPGPPPAGRISPLAPSPCGAICRLGYPPPPPPRQWTLWIRHWTETWTRNFIEDNNECFTLW